MSGTPTNRATIYVLYNANASLFGKVKYVYEKLTCAKDDSPCAACDLTHGGLKLHESDEWKATKKQIPANVQQLHLDELTPEVRNPPLRPCYCPDCPLTMIASFVNSSDRTVSAPRPCWASRPTKAR